MNTTNTMKTMLMLMLMLMAMAATLGGCGEKESPATKEKPQEKHETAQSVKPPVSPEVQRIRLELERIKLQRLKRQVKIREQDAKARAEGYEPRERIVRNPEAEAMSDEELAAAIKKLEAEVGAP